MKKIIIAIFFMTSSSLTFAQQSIDFDNLRFGLQLSPTFSWMSSDAANINGNGVNIGLKLAMMGEYYFTENYALTTGLGFAFNQGGTLRHANESSYWNTGQRFISADLKYSIQYIEIPLGLKMRTREFGYFSYYGEPFLTLGFRSQARGDIKDTDFNDEELRDFVGGAALSWGLGAGVEYSISDSSSLIGGLYFQNNFTDITKDVDMGDESKSGFRNITIRLGILF